MSVVKGRIVEGGRLIVPAHYRKAMGLSKGDAIVMELHGDELRIRPARSALVRLQETLKRYRSVENFASDELIGDRRREASNE